MVFVFLGVEDKVMAVEEEVKRKKGRVEVRRERTVKVQAEHYIPKSTKIDHREFCDFRTFFDVKRDKCHDCG